MSNITKSESSITEGSIYDVANRQQQKPENILATADVVVMLDKSSSMDIRTMSGRTRMDHARESVAQIQRSFPGRVVLCEFDNSAQLRFGGVPSQPSGSTAAHLALELCRKFDGMGMKFYFISDGEPDSAPAAIEQARLYVDPINCIFIGDDYAPGQAFMRELAAVTGGVNAGHVDASQLGDKVTLMLTGRTI